MEILPVIINILLALSGIFLIVLIISYLISKFRKGKKVITESYPAEKYKYYSGSDTDSQSQFPMNKFYYIVDNESVDGNYNGCLRNEYSSSIYRQQINNNPMMEYNEPETYGNQRADYEEKTFFENPLRKTASFNSNVITNNIGNKNRRMTIVNDEPLFKYGWD